MTVAAADQTSTRAAHHHLFALTVENKPNVLARVVGLISRRGFNIFSLAVAPTPDDRFSRISIVVDADSAPLQQVLEQLNKLINVVRIDELHPDDACEAELMLVTARGIDDAAPLTDAGGRVLEVAHGRATAVFAAPPDELDALADSFVDLLGEGAVEVVRTGRVALPKLSGPRSGR